MINTLQIIPSYIWHVIIIYNKVNLYVTISIFNLLNVASKHARIIKIAVFSIWERPHRKLMLRVRFGDPDHDQVLRTKTWSGAKTTWSSWPGHTCSSIWEASFSLGSWSWSMISNARDKKEPILDSYFYENAYLCMLNAKHKVQNCFKSQQQF